MLLTIYKIEEEGFREEDRKMKTNGNSVSLGTEEIMVTPFDGRV